MTAATSLLSYQDMLSLMEKAKDNTLGIRVRYASEGDARQARMRFNKARALDREANLDAFPKEHKLHGRSLYDDLFATIDIEDEKVWLRIEKRTIHALEIEPLGEDNEQQEPPHRTGGEMERETEQGGDEGEKEVEALFNPQTADPRRF